MNTHSFLSRTARWRRLAVALVLGSVLSLTFTGCIAVAAGAAGAGVAWVRGALEVTVDASLDRTYAAAQSAVRSLEFAPISEKKSGVDASVLARTALDKRVEIVLKRTGDKSTHVSIRVGVFGDEALSVSILERLKREL
jgi:hypothetical protein